MIGRFPAQLVDERYRPKPRERSIKHVPTHHLRILSRCVDCKQPTLMVCGNARCFHTERTTRNAKPHKCAISKTKSESGYLVREARRVFGDML